MSSTLTHLLTSHLAIGGLPILFALMTLEGAGLPIPSEIVLPFAGILVSKGLLDFWAVVVWASIGQTAGALLTYGLGRYGEKLLAKKQVLPGVTIKTATAADRWFSRFGEVTVLACRLLPGVRGVISVPTGFARMPIYRFVAFSSVGIAIWTVLLVWGGVKSGVMWEASKWSTTIRATGFVGLAAVLFLGIWLFFRAKPNR